MLDFTPAYCNNCGIDAPADSDLPPEQRVPCWNCGSTSRRYTHTLEASVAPIGDAMPNQGRAFFGREADLHRLNLLVKQGRKVISVIGPPGVGKTALVYQYISDKAVNWTDVWRRPSFLPLGQEFLFRESLPSQPLLAVLDGADAADPHDLIDYLNEARGSAQIQSLILTSRRSLLDFGPLTEFTIEPLTARDFLSGPSAQGLLYDIAENIGSADKAKIVEAVNPAIIRLNDSIIKGLKRRPSDVHLLNGFQFEEIVADLLQDQGYEVELTPRRKDGGKDILAWIQTPLARLLTLVEVKNYRADRPVGPRIGTTTLRRRCTS